MGDSILTPLQQDVLNGFFAQGAGDQGYFLTGGTALAEFYLKHRYSQDLDFFNRRIKSVKDEEIYFMQALEKIGLETEVAHRSENFIRLQVKSRLYDSGPLRVDIASDISVQIAPTKDFSNIIVDSLEDIAVNKITAIVGRGPSEIKDFVDLYFILRETGWALEFILERAKAKEALLDDSRGKLIFADILMKVEEFPSLMGIKMVKPLILADLKTTLLDEAKRIIKSLEPLGPSAG